MDKDGNIGRGKAICSPNDNPCKKEGRKYARDYALRALGTKSTSMPVTNKKALDIVGKLPLDDYIVLFFNKQRLLDVYKSEYNPVLSNPEKKLLFGKEKNNENLK
jgi:hypothetical protein